MLKSYILWSAAAAIILIAIGSWLFTAGNSLGLFLYFGGFIVFVIGTYIDMRKIWREMGKYKRHPSYKQARQPNGHFARKNPLQPPFDKEGSGDLSE